jgi:hypothetical protein
MQWKPWHWLDKCLGKKAWAIHGCLNGILSPGQTGKVEMGEEQIQEHGRHFLQHQGVCLKEIRPSRPDSQFHVLWRCFTAIAWKCAKTSPHIFYYKRTGYCVTATYRLTLPFWPGNFQLKATRLVVPHPPYFFLSPRLKIKLKGRYFDTIEVVETEMQMVLNSLMGLPGCS